uniref:Alpha/beta hydrolase fold-3 domain-containing protein n=1 Tax=Ananas comosus var. bracteatus TaxID=296719 RepID=A0A6V7QFJ6_ANACO|nr:unnamed protein product [Ananas comosus var. bracteatus]
MEGLLYDPQHDLHLRLYRPRRDRSSDHCSSEKLPPLLLPRRRLLHRLPHLAQLPRLVPPPRRRAQRVRHLRRLPPRPEHRLPAAVDDGATALSWLRSQAEAGAGADPWIAESVDFGRVFVSGDSAGGTSPTTWPSVSGRPAWARSASAGSSS